MALYIYISFLNKLKMKKEDSPKKSVFPSSKPLEFQGVKAVKSNTCLVQKYLHAHETDREREYKTGIL